jgi:hypothetical protein
MKFLNLKCSMAALVLLAPGLLSASAIGTLEIAGVGPVAVSATTIDFSPAGTGTGNFLVTGTAGDMTTVPIGSIGTISDLNVITAPPGGPLATPVDPFILVPGVAPLFSYNLEQIFLGGAPSCAAIPGVGGSCTPSNLVPNSPFVLTQNNGSVGVQFSGRGTVTNLTDLSQAPYSGLFTANLTVLQYNTIAEVLAQVAGGGAVSSSWSASFTSSGGGSTVPEPATFGLIGTGLIGLALVARRRTSSTSNN